ncbi:MerR family transcriptional regulator [bacterium]|nr:MAG: MerR family transcriptional regulator [bacterium]
MGKVPRGNEFSGVFVGITEVGRLVGRTAKTLRRWEKERLVVPMRDAQGRRRYSEDDIARCKELARHARAAQYSSRKLGDIIPHQLSLLEAIDD